ncbi:MAG: hypothetical protein HQ538_06440 [Parcubacteria group bacterium]|nr:hypothetical protein [Parcubacteria group bacterium]
MQTPPKIRVFFCCARWLGIECLKFATTNNDIEIIGVSNLAEGKPGWWEDVNELEEIKALDLNLVRFEDIKNFIHKEKPDLIFSILTDYIFKEEDLQNTKCGVINLHPAPLPKYRGCNSYTHAIMNQEDTYSVTMHYVDPTIDTGPVIDIGTLKIEEDDTVKKLYDKSQIVALNVFKKNLPLIISGIRSNVLVKGILQDSKLASYYKRDSLFGLKNLSDFTSNALFYDYVRALQFEPFEPAYILCGVDNNGKERKVYLRIT